MNDVRAGRHRSVSAAGGGAADERALCYAEAAFKVTTTDEVASATEIYVVLVRRRQNGNEAMEGEAALVDSWISDKQTTGRVLL